MNGPEETIASVVQYLRLAVERTGAAMVALGAAIAIVLFMRALLMGRADDFNAIRLVLARYLALALEFQLGGPTSSPLRLRQTLKRLANWALSPPSGPASIIFFPWK
jgi:uncharacterized membrane protein